MSASRSSSPTFDAEAFRLRFQERLSVNPPGSRGSISSDAAQQPPPRSSPTGRSSIPRGVGSRGTVPGGVSSGGGLSGKFSNKQFTVALVSPLCCRGRIDSSIWGEVMCSKLKCNYQSHAENKVVDFPEEPVYCLDVGHRGWVYPTPCILKSECSLDMEERLNQLMLNDMEEWEEVCYVAAEEAERNKPTEEVPIKQEGEDSGKLDVNLNEVTRVPKLSYVDLDLPENVDDGKQEEPTISALRNLLEFSNSTVMMAEYTKMAVEDLSGNQFGIASNLDGLAQMVFRVSDVLGDREYILQQYGTLAEAVFALKEEDSTLAANYEELDVKIENLDFTLNKKIEIMCEEQAKALAALKVSPPPVASQPPDLSSVLDNAGRLHPDLEIGMVDGKVYTLRWLLLKTLKHDEDLKDIRGMIEAKGGVSLGQFKFDSPEHLKNTILKDLPKGVAAGVIRCFVDCITIFVAGVEPSTSEQSSFKKLNPDLTAKDSALIHQHQVATCPAYTGKKVDVEDAFPVGKPIECFKDPDAWDGAGLDGKQTMIASAAENSASKLKGLATSLLRHSPTLLALALEMADKSEKWHTKFHAHLAKELKILEKLKLPVTDVFLLFSDLFRLIVELYHAERSEVHAIDDAVDPVDRLTTIIWTSLKVHGLMQDFLDADFKNHPIVQAAFVRFLTTKIGQNTAAALSSDVKKLEKKVASSEAKVNGAVSKAAAAENAARSVDQQLTHLKNKNPDWNR